MIQLLDKTTTFNLLYDFYRPLLNEKQQTFMALYYAEDWSLGEIAEHYGISRQAVHDHIKRTEKTLSHMEDALRLVEKHTARKQLIKQVERAIADRPDVAKRVRPLLDQLLAVD
ncbi:putative DNA-binding protein [Numidum massiliense]|uniref:putative DNA-binding protein n=1 Tax=Numidum massiliense TaxID=1522315 RepID=UPI0006D58E1E|nr:putative DNA-binding protein [Numidum massiliense]